MKMYVTGTVLLTHYFMKEVAYLASKEISMLPIFNTASEVGYGAVIASLAGFVIIRDMVLNVSSNPLISEAIAMNILAGITGSSSGVCRLLYLR